MQTPDNEKRRNLRKELLALTVCLTVGVLLSSLPHLLLWRIKGDAVWLAHDDDLLYLAYASQAYHNHPFFLTDPVRVSGGETMYPWLQLAPGVLITKFLGFEAIDILLIWRVLAGISIALGWYCITRHYLKHAWGAAALTIFLLSDIGFWWGKPLFKMITTFFQVAFLGSGEIFRAYAGIHGQWRLITPGLSLIFLLLHLWMVARARDNQKWRRLVIAGLSLGALFYTYFYYWTAAVVALALAMVFDRRYYRVYLHCGWIGAIIGAPSVISHHLSKHNTLPDWLHRSDLFLPIPRFSELLIPSGAILMLLMCFIMVRRWRQDLIHLWALGVAGAILSNHQLITGLQLQNFHWVHYVLGPSLSLLVMLLVAGILTKIRLDHRAWAGKMAWGVALFLAAHFSIALWLRAQEATRTKWSQEMAEVYSKYREQRLNQQLPKLAPNAVISGESGFTNLAVIAENQRPLEHYAVMMSPEISNEEWDSRIALNGYLLGLDRKNFEVEQRKLLESSAFGPWVRSRDVLEKRLMNRLSVYDRIALNSLDWLSRFNVRYVALPIETKVPDYLKKDWRPLDDGPYWRLWERLDISAHN